MTTQELTSPELAVYKVLVKLVGEGNFQYQTPFMGGRMLPGGVIADFYIPYLSLIISVIGVYWHRTRERRGQDEMQRMALLSRGITTIYIDEEDANKNAYFYVSEALKLISHSSVIRED